VLPLASLTAFGRGASEAQQMDQKLHGCRAFVSHVCSSPYKWPQSSGGGLTSILEARESYYPSRQEVKYQANVHYIILPHSQ